LDAMIRLYKLLMTDTLRRQLKKNESPRGRI